VLVALVWELVARFVITSTLLFVPFSSVVVTLVKSLQSGELAYHTWVSGVEFFLGFALAAVVGIPLGLAMATNETLSDFVDPVLAALYATPTVALAPLFILWLGVDTPSKIAVVFLVAVFPILINTATGVRSVDGHLVEAAHAFGSSRLQIFTKVLVPSSLPFIIAGLRLGVGRGIVGVVVGELFGARAGLGFMLIQAGQVFDTAGLFAGVLVLAVTGVLSVAVLQRLEQRLAPWREVQV
jgi:NitT/TauT family transport system permease protein